jgi:acetyl-CoA carboxylase alpha subunit
MAQSLKTALVANLERLSRQPVDQLVEGRYERVVGFGRYAED